MSPKKKSKSKSKSASGETYPVLSSNPSTVLSLKSYTFEEVFAELQSGSKEDRIQAARALSACCAYSTWFQAVIKSTSSSEETCVVNHLLRLLSELGTGDSIGDVEKDDKEEDDAQEVLAALYALTDVKSAEDAENDPLITTWNENAKHLRGKISISPYRIALVNQKSKGRVIYARELVHRARTIIEPDKYQRVATVRIDKTKQLMTMLGLMSLDGKKPKEVEKEKEKVTTRRVLKVKNRNCDNCGKKAENFCKKCFLAMYCCKDCQIAKWGQHKKICDSWPATSSERYLSTAIDVYQDRHPEFENLSLYEFLVEGEILPSFI
ncbi:hypothetical protein JAAARDRAFT_209966 [Jaapia argillacea MUCL 33604]|uniref:MYND-type domain-containing protein n=1 Tax=Jaapia argillacea MUCL 33604 TaxID=933084 RepID=A0A067PIG3_9AGAM|nr:hypothetical protein JAAARDRAFT_209966 [Jaapia argillacea MUCL 33604]